MTPIHSLEDLELFKQDLAAKKARYAKGGMIQVVVSMGSCGIAAGAEDTFLAVQEQIKRLRLENIMISKTGCIGLCGDEPILQVITNDGRLTNYRHVNSELVKRIFQEHILDGKIILDHQITI